MEWTKGVKSTRVGLVQLECPPAPLSMDESLRGVAAMLRRAGTAGCDVACIPECCLPMGLGGDWTKAAVPLPGPVSRVLSKEARRARMYVVGWQIEIDRGAVYNTSFLLDRAGRLAARHRKTHLTVAESRAGFSAGDRLDTFQTDFGRVGIMICYESYFPEIPRCLALQGAQIIFHPLQGDSLAEQWLVKERAHALNNGVVVASAQSHFSGAATAIIDKMGMLIGRDDHKNRRQLIKVDVDLKAEAITHTYAFGRHRERHHALLFAQRRPDLYRALIEPWKGARIEKTRVPPLARKSTAKRKNRA
ncbi:MAG: carbon-nitrogen hydrolase family protein [Verrucomicrobia bacterium]|nr:carbon-nitrogen hydrolase family protein [Verrucomicrobiota bacterium]